MSKKEKKDNISIVIPVYNGEETIQRCLDSVVKQSSRNIEEIIVVDDGSSDKTIELIEVFIEQDSRIHCIKKKNEGVSSARNIGIRNAHGEYIMFIDSDDEIKKDLVRELYQAIDGYDLTIAGIELHQEARLSTIGIDGVFSNKQIIEMYGNAIPGLLINGPCSKLYRKNIIDEHDLLFEDSLSLGEDTEFVFRYLKYCNNIRFIEYYGYIYFQLGSNSLMTRFRKDAYYNAKKVYNLLTDTVVEICDGKIPQNYRRAYRNVLMVYIRKTIYNRRQIEDSYIRDIIGDFIKDEMVRSTITNDNKGNCMEKIINILINKKKDMLLYLLLKMHVKARGI